MKNKKSELIIIVVLLSIFLPLTIIGILSKNNISPIEPNPNHETYYDGYMWFYDNTDKFLSKYECKTEKCEYAKSTIDDEVYGINYYKDGKNKSVSLINNKFTFVTDGAVTYLYTADNGSILQNYKAIKTYNTQLENNYYIIQDSNGVWGIIKITDTLNAILPFEYSFIGLKNKMNEDGTLNTSRFIVQKDTKWFIVDNNNSAITGLMDDVIIDYDDNYVFCKSNDRIKIYSYDNHEYLTNYNIKNYILEDTYIGVVTDRALLIYDNLANNYLKNITLPNDAKEIDIEKTNNSLNIKIDNNIVETIELS